MRIRFFGLPTFQFSGCNPDLQQWMQIAFRWWSFVHDWTCEPLGISSCSRFRWRTSASTFWLNISAMVTSDVNCLWVSSLISRLMEDLLPLKSLPGSSTFLPFSSLVTSVIGICWGSFWKVRVNSLGGELIFNAMDGLTFLLGGEPTKLAPAILPCSLDVTSMLCLRNISSNLWSALSCGCPELLASPLLFGDLDGYGALFARFSDLLGALDLSPMSVTSTFIGVSSTRCSCWLCLIMLHDKLDLPDLLSVSRLSELTLATVWSLTVLVSAGAAKSGVSAGEFVSDINWVVNTNPTYRSWRISQLFGLLSKQSTADNLSRDMTPIYLPIMVSIVEQLLCNGCVAAHSSLTFGPNLAISVRSVPWAKWER